MSGFSDEFYTKKHSLYKSLTLEKKDKNFSTDECPTFWFQPTEVWEIRGADLTVSPVHHAGNSFLDMIEELDLKNAHGISLRFPRFIRVRSDKCIENATTSQDIIKMFMRQSQRN